MSHPAPHARRIAILFTILSAVTGAWGEAQEQIFYDGFESGDISAWNSPTPILPMLNFSDQSFTVNEWEGPLTIQVELSTASETPVSFDWYTNDGTANAGEDFTPDSGTVTIPQGSLTGTIEISMVDDSTAEWAQEKFTLHLSNPVGAELPQITLKTVAIVDDDQPEIYLEGPEGAGSESEGTVAVKFVLSEVSTAAVFFELNNNSITAVAGEDYFDTGGMWFIPAGEYSKTLPIEIFDDSLYEGPEYFEIELLEAVNAVLGEPTTVSVTIEDNDPIPEISFPQAAVQVSEGAGSIDVELQLSAISGLDSTVRFETIVGSAAENEDYVLASGILEILAGQLTGSITVEIEDDLLIEGDEKFTVALSDPVNVTFGSAMAAEVTIVDDEPRPIISSPLEGTFFYDGDSFDVDANGSHVPDGFNVWLAVLAQNGDDPMPIVEAGSGLTTAFTASEEDAGYVARLVIATPTAMPNDLELRGESLPCTFGEESYECAATEVHLTAAEYWHVQGFETSYVLPGGVFLRWKRIQQAWIERSEDGGATWTRIDEYENSLFKYFFVDENVEEGATYYYRLHMVPGDIYLGRSDQGPGLPVTIPEWSAPRPVPELLDVEWNCPRGATKEVCVGVLHLRLVPEVGQSLSGTTIKVFLNEDTYQQKNGIGDDARIGWPDGLNHFEGRDVPACVVERETPDVEVEVPEGADDSVQIALDGVRYGVNGLRFEVRDSIGGVSRRAILVVIHNDEVQNAYDVPYFTLKPLLSGSVISTPEFTLRGVGPASRYSPDCIDGDRTYLFVKDYDSDAIYANFIDFEGQDRQFVGTDENGRWSLPTISLVDDEYDLYRRTVSTSFYADGAISRNILDEDGGLVTDRHSVYVYCSVGSATTPLTVDSTVTELAPRLDYVVPSIYIDSGETEAVGQFPFRITDADQNLRFHDIQAFNLSVAEPQQVRAFYAIDQLHPEGQWGWFVVELPMVRGANTIEFCAQDETGEVLGTVEKPCVTATVIRESPLVIAEITDPPGDFLSAPPGSIIHLDGSQSTMPEGGVAVWTTGWDSPHIGTDWKMRETTIPTGDPSELVTNIVMPHDVSQRYMARLIVAASPEDLPDDFWPWNGDPPCEREGSGGRCDSAEVRLDPDCNRDPTYTPVVIDEPQPPAQFGLRDTIQLSANVSDSENEPYAYRWNVYRRTSGIYQWLVTTIGADDDGDGYSTANSNLSFVPSEIGLGYGEYQLIAEARYPASGCAGQQWYLGADLLNLKIGHSIEGVAPGTVVEGDWFRVYSSSMAEFLDPGELGVILIDDDDEPYDDQLVQYLVPMNEGGFFELPADPNDMPANGGTTYFIRVAENQSWDGLSSSVKIRVVPPGSDADPNVIEVDEPSSCAGGVIVDVECAQPIVPGQVWRGEWAETGDSDYLTFIAGAGTGVRVTLRGLGNQPQVIRNVDPTVPEVLLARPDGLIVASSDPAGHPSSDAVIETTLGMAGRYFVIVRTGRGTGSYTVKLEKSFTGGSGEPTFGYTKTRSYVATSTTPITWFRVPLLDHFGEPISGAAVKWHLGADCGDGSFCSSGASDLTFSSEGGLVEHLGQSEVGVVQLLKPEALLSVLPQTKAAVLDIRRGSTSPTPEPPVLGRIWTDGRAVTGMHLPTPETVHEILEKHQLLGDLRKSNLAKDGPQCNAAGPTCVGGSGELVFSAAQHQLNPGERLVDIQVFISKNGEVIEVLDGEEVVTAVPLTVEAQICVQDSLGINCDIPLDGPIAMLVTTGHGAALERDGVICNQLVGAPGGLTYWVGRDAITNITEDVEGFQIRRVPVEWIDAVVVGNIMVDDGQGGFYPVSRRAETTVESTPRAADVCDIRPYPPHPTSGWVPEIAGEGPVSASAGAMRQYVGSFYLTDACGNLLDDLAAGQSIRVTSPISPPVGADLEQTSFGWQWHFDLVGTQVSGEFPNQTVDIPGGLYQIGLEIDSESVCSSNGAITDGMTVNYSNGRPRLELKWDIGRGGEPDARSLSVAPGDHVGNRLTSQVAWRIRPGKSGTTFGDARYTDVPVRAFVAESLVVMDTDGEVTEHIAPVPDTALCSGVVHRLYDPETMVYPGLITVTCGGHYDNEAVLTVSTEELGAWADEAYDGIIGTTVGVSRAPSRPGRYYLVVEPVPGPNGDLFRRDGAWELDTENNREFYVLPMDLEVQYLAEDRGQTPHEMLPGAGVVVNADDDDGDGTPDRLQVGPVSEEDNLIPARITLDDSLMDEGEAVLRRSGNQIKVWSSKEKGASADVLTEDSVSEKVWDLTDPDERADFEAVRDNLWIEGNVGSLEPRDVELSFTYRNGDAEGTDTVLVSAIPLKMRIFPFETTELNADYPAVPLAVGLFLEGSDGVKRPVEDGARVEWVIEKGSGGLLGETSTATSDGFTSTVLNVQRTSGSNYTVSGSAIDVIYDGWRFDIGPYSQRSGVLSVVAGAAQEIDVSLSKPVYAADNIDTLTLNATVRDGYGNLVRDGTGVSWDITGLGGVLENEESEETIDGVVETDIRSGFISEVQELLIQADQYALVEEIDSEPVQVSIYSNKSSLDIALQEQAVITAVFSSAGGEPVADGTPVSWFTTLGTVVGNAVINGGVATATLTAISDRVGTAVVSVGTANTGEEVLVPFTSSGLLSLEVEHPVLAGNAVSDGWISVEQIDGTFDDFQYHASSSVTVHGEPGSTVAVWPSTTTALASYPFDFVSEGATPDVIGGHTGTVNGAGLDEINFIQGTASFAFYGNDNVMVEDDVLFDFIGGFETSIWVYPTSLQSALIVGKSGEFGLAIEPDGILEFRVETDQGMQFVASSVPLTTFVWQRVVARYEVGTLSVTVGSTTASSPAIGSLLQSANPITVGEGFEGNLDQFDLKADSPGASGLVTLSGLDSSGNVVLDENGLGTVVVQSNGILTAENVFRHVLLNVATDPSDKSGRKNTGGYGYYVRHKFLLLDDQIIAAFKNLWKGFFTGRGAGLAGMSGDFIAAVWAWGDIRDFFAEPIRALVPGGDDGDWAVFGFAFVGLLTTIPEVISLPSGGWGVSLDAAVAAVKIIIKRIPKGPMRSTLVEVFLDIMKTAIRSPTAAVDEVRRFSKLFGSLASSSDGRILRLSEVLSSRKRLERAAELVDDFGDDGLDLLVAIPGVLDYEAEFAQVFLKVFADVGDSARIAIKSSPAAAAGLAKLLKKGANPEYVQRVLDNSDAFTDIYRHEHFLADAQIIIDSSPDLRINTLNESLKKIMKQTPENYGGFTFEFRSAAHVIAEHGGGITDLDSLDNFGTDFFSSALGWTLQSKRSANALRNARDGTLATAEEYLLDSIAIAKAQGLTDYRLCFPKDAKDFFTAGIRDLLQRTRFYTNGPTLWDTIVDVPGFISDPSILPKRSGGFDGLVSIRE